MPVCMTRGDGKVLVSHIELSQGYIGDKLGLSRQWVNTLVGRLVDAGWLVASSTWTGENMRSSTCFSAGRSLRPFGVSVARESAEKATKHACQQSETHLTAFTSFTRKKTGFCFSRRGRRASPVIYDPIRRDRPQELATRFMQLGQEVEQPSTDHLAESAPLIPARKARNCRA